MHIAKLCRLCYSDLIREEYRGSIADEFGTDAADLADFHITQALGEPKILLEHEIEDIEWVYLESLGDRHVLRAASKGQVECLLTENLGDFPTEYVYHHNNDWLNLTRDFCVANLDAFLCGLYALDSNIFVQAFADTTYILERDGFAAKDVLDGLRDEQNCKELDAKLSGKVGEIDNIVARLKVERQKL